MTDTEFLPSGPAFPPRRAVELDPEAQRREAALDADLNVARIADALDLLATRHASLMLALVAAVERFAALLAEPEPGDERTGEPDPEPPIDAAPAWAPVKGGRAWLPFGAVDAVLAGNAGELVTVDRLYESEGTVVAHVVTEDGDAWTLPASSLEPPR